MSSALKYADVAGKTDAGNRYGKLNQDRHFVARMEGIGDFFGVFDGHGPRAELASERCAEECKRTAKGVKPEDMDSQEHIVAWINSLFGRLQTAAESVEEEAPPRVASDGTEKPLDMGSTALICIRVGDDVYLAGVGDCEAYLGFLDAEGRRRVVHVSHTPHKASNKKELERIKRDADGPEHATLMPNKVYLTTPDPRLAHLQMARALGHRHWHQYGMTFSPDITKFTMQSDHQEYVLVLASDGVWDRISGEKAIGLASDAGSGGDGAAAVVEHVISLAASEHLRQDNTTAVVARL